MISNHLSLIEPLRAKSDELAAQVAEFVAAGGKIEEAEAQNYKYKSVSYSNQMPPAPKPFVRRRVEAAPLPLARSNIRVQERLKLVERVRCLAVNHPKIEVAAELGIDRRTVSKIGKEFRITFKAPSRGGTRNLVPKRVDDAKDARLAEQSRNSWRWASPGGSAAASSQSVPKPSNGSSPSTVSTTPKRAKAALHAPHSPHPATQTSNPARTT